LFFRGAVGSTDSRSDFYNTLKIDTSAALTSTHGVGAALNVNGLLYQSG